MAPAIVNRPELSDEECRLYLEAMEALGDRARQAKREADAKRVLLADEIDRLEERARFLRKALQALGE